MQVMMKEKVLSVGFIHKNTGHMQPSLQHKPSGALDHHALP